MGASDTKQDLLFLCHRIPFPPNKGDKIRSFHLLRYLAQEFCVHLGAFVDDPSDWGHRETVATYCGDCQFVPLRRSVATLRGMAGFLEGTALTVPYYRDRRMAAWVDRVWEKYRIRHVVVFSSGMAQYVMDERFRQARRVIDFVDVDSDKWRQYAASKPLHSAWVYRREARRLAAFERKVATTLDLSLFVSPEEAQVFDREVLGGLSARVDYWTNGVDTEFFAPDPQRPSPFPAGVRAVVFTGAMDYWANVDAVSWFATEVLPRVRIEHPGTRFYIVGSRPSEAVSRLAGDGVVVTGAVADVRPYLQHAAVVVAPMRIARGIQNKVLEGMAMARPVVVSSRGLEGISAGDGDAVLVADRAEDFAGRVGRVLDGPDPELGGRARRFVTEHHGWSVTLGRFGQFLQD